MKNKKMLKNVLKAVFIILAILILLFIIHTIRNYVIITDLQNKISPYKDSTNYYIKSVSTENNGTVVTLEYYKKDNRQAVFLERNLNGEINKISMYDNGERTDVFWDNKENKTAQIDSGAFMAVGIYNNLETDNKWQTFLGSISSKVKSANYNGKECYIIKGFLSSTSLTFEGAETYIDKETGLFVKITEDDIVSEREYEFDKVEDSIFIEPDISQYKMKEKE